MRTLFWVILGLLWLAAGAFGLVGVTAYEATPSGAGVSGPRWPAASALARNSTGPTLLLFAHPHCPCTRATLAELDRVLTHSTLRPRLYVLFVRPPGVAAGWEHTDLWQTAAALPGVTVLADEAGQEARRFGAVASGHAVLYDEAGKLVFSGGITAARGHEGDSLGADELLAALGASQQMAHSAPTRPASPARAPVFGCSLLTSEY